jgi:DNA-binding NarL/FixJ family response regulator
MHAADPIDILIVEDHEEYRLRLASMLGMEARHSCRAVATGEAALLAVEERLPDVVIMDINLQGPSDLSSSVGPIGPNGEPRKGMSGIDCTRVIKAKHPNVQVLICTVHEDEQRIFEALKAGATGYVLKRSPLSELLDAIDQIMDGGSPMSGRIARKVVGSFQPKAQEPTEQLTAREQEVLELLAQGMQMKEIAPKLFVSLTTIRTHVRNIYEKLQVQSRYEMMKKTGRYR